MIAAAFIAACTNILTVFTITYSDIVPYSLNYFVNLAFLILQNSTAPLWFSYILLLTKEKLPWKKYVILYIPYILSLLLLTTNIITRWVFYFNSSNVYCRGFGINILYFNSVFYLALSVFHVVMHQKVLSNERVFAIYFFLISTICAIIIQFIMPHFLITGFASALSCLIMYVSLQNPEENLDNATKIFNRNAAITMINDYLKQGQQFTMIVLALDEFRKMNDKYGFDTGDEFLRLISSYLSELVPNSIYRLDGDFFGILFEKEQANAEEIIENIRERFQKQWYLKDAREVLSTCICCISCPEDAGTVTEVMDTLNHSIADAKQIGKGTIIYAAEHIENRERKISELEAQKKLLEKISAEAENARKEAEKADRIKSIFLANMSHEIRTPMNAILGMTELILRRDLEDQVRENVENIKGAGETLLAIINDILDISKIESGKLALIEDHYYISSLFNDITHMICSRLKNKDVEFLIEIDNTIPDELFGDQLRLRQVLLNILGNAVKFTTKGFVKLIVNGERKEDNSEICLHISVLDTGYGIKKEDIPRLFDSFSRVNSKKTQNIEGTGLGLAICRQLVECMGGEITVESEFGIGSKFSFHIYQKIDNGRPIVEIDKKEQMKVAIISGRIAKQVETVLQRFPVSYHYIDEGDMDWDRLKEKNYTHLFMEEEVYYRHKKEVESLRLQMKLVVLIPYGELFEDYNKVITVQSPIYCLNVAEALSGVSYEKNRKIERDFFYAPEARILVVDDNAVNLKVTEGLLKFYGVQITKALSGQECIRLLKQNKYHLIYLDHMMPDMDGIETLKQIRKLEGEYYKTVPIVALTANAIRGVREMFYENGFQGYVSKPIDILCLEDSLKEFLPSELILKKERAERKEEQFPFEIPGVNVEIGMKHCGGILKTYWELLEMFLLEGKIKYNVIKEYVETDNIQNYMVEAHALKSVAASMGAEHLSETAKQHEMAAKAENYVFVQKEANGLLEQYKTLLLEVDKIIGLRDLKKEKIENKKDKETLTEVNKKELALSIMSDIEQFEDEQAILKIDRLLRCNRLEEKIDCIKSARENIKLLNYKKALESMKKVVEGLE